MRIHISEYENLGNPIFDYGEFGNGIFDYGESGNGIFHYGGCIMIGVLYGVLQGVRKSMDLSIGEIAYTSGISEIYPANIPVAKVISVNKNNNSPFQDVVVEILSNLNNLNYVFVIQ